MCDHKGGLRYARRIFSNGTVHFCVQCVRCLETVKTARHEGRLLIKQSEIPQGAVIFDWVDPSAAQGGLFDE